MYHEDRTKMIIHMIGEIKKSMEVNDFQLEFFESMESQFMQRKTLSDKQFASMKKIYERITDV